MIIDLNAHLPAHVDYRFACPLFTTSNTEYAAVPVPEETDPKKVILHPALRTPVSEREPKIAPPANTSVNANVTALFKATTNDITLQFKEFLTTHYDIAKLPGLTLDDFAHAMRTYTQINELLRGVILSHPDLLCITEDISGEDAERIIDRFIGGPLSDEDVIAAMQVISDHEIRSDTTRYHFMAERFFRTLLRLGVKP